MGELVLAAKMTHVPTMLMSEQPGPVEGKRQAAIEGHYEVARRAQALGVDTVVICDTHWVLNAGYHVNARARFKGLFTSNEFPQFIQDMPYDHEGNPELGDLIAARATARGVHTLSHHMDTLSVEYGTLVPMRFMSRIHPMKVVSVGAWCTVHSYEGSRKLGEAIREAIEASDSRVLLVASGSLSHRIWPNDDYAANNGTFTISKEFNRQVDLRVLELWQNGDWATFTRMLPEYAEYCCGEGSMHDTAMLLGALGWDGYTGRGEIVTDYFPSSGTGQTNVIFPVS
jgi:3,4-dihydroxyphenylacetate 2,3-dioxygenase